MITAPNCAKLWDMTESGENLPDLYRVARGNWNQSLNTQENHRGRMRFLHRFRLPLNILSFLGLATVGAAINNPSEYSAVMSGVGFVAAVGGSIATLYARGKYREAEGRFEQTRAETARLWNRMETLGKSFKNNQSPNDPR